VTWAHVGRRGYLSAAQLRELSDLGFEVGSHSLTHSYLNDLPPERVRAEVAGSKERLEQLTGRRVAHFSCPGGRTNALVTEAARAAGYESVATSRLGVNAPGADPFALARVAVMRGTTGESFERLCRAEGFGLRRVRGAFLTAAKRVLGNAVYEKVRATALGRH
jgi:peptidoglycan/xylan/chitin deacetylase (PgdA/CDA1 family)